MRPDACIRSPESAKPRRGRSRARGTLLKRGECMFTWICPQCGREVPPAYNDCPDCAKTAAGGGAPAAAAAANLPVQQPPAFAPPPPQQPYYQQPPPPHQAPPPGYYPP